MRVFFSFCYAKRKKHAYRSNGETKSGARNLTIDRLTPGQQAVIAGPPTGKTFLLGPAGSGKTTATVARLLLLVEMGVPADQILVLVPQRTLATPYYEM